MNRLCPLWLNNFCLIQHIAKILLVSLGFTATAFGQVVEEFVPSKSTELWREWMSDAAVLYDGDRLFGREASQVFGPRCYLMTERTILQTSASAAKFQEGKYRIVLADGSVPSMDGDLDYYTDTFEVTNPHAYYDDPLRIPLGGNPLMPLPTDAMHILLANGDVAGITSWSKTPYTTNAKWVKAFSGANVRLTGAPASNLKPPAGFTDYSSSFYYYFVSPGQTTGTYSEFQMSLYLLEKEFLNPGDCNALESSVVEGVYQVEFPTIPNPPYGTSAVQVAHRVVPNGTLTIGTYKKPTWLIRSLTSVENPTKPPVAKSWVNGKIKFDPYLPMTISWDKLVENGLATVNDYIDIYIEDDDTGGRVSYKFRVKASDSALTIDNSAAMKLIYGDFRSFLGKTSPPLSVNGHIVMKYRRYANRQSAADLSTVTVRVPVEMAVSYASWRTNWFPSSPTTDSISGPSADPDKDGLTNQQEYDQGSNPTVARVVVTNPTSANITANTATLGGKITCDTFTTPAVTFYERGVVYSSVNSTPVIDGSGVSREVDSSALPDPLPPLPPLPPTLEPLSYDVFLTANLTGLTGNTNYYFRAYTITSAGTYYTTPVSSFKTLPEPTLPAVTLPTSSIVITGTPAVISADLGGTVTSDGRSSIIERGVVYSETSLNDDPLIDGANVTKVAGTGTTGLFKVNVKPLLRATLYSYKAYATNSVGTNYTTEISTFTTPDVPTVISLTSTDITSTSAKLGGEVTSNGGSALQQRGVVYSLTSVNADPTIGGVGVTNLSAPPAVIGAFTVNANGLSGNKGYSFKAYAFNGVGTFYTAVGTFTTDTTLATITSPTNTGITSSTATLGANVTNDGASPITERGLIYSKTSVNSNPIIGGTGVTKVIVAGTVGVFNAPITGLAANTGYTFKAYAINGKGTAYSSFVSFSTLLIQIADPTVASITATSALLGGTVSGVALADVIERGVVYSQFSINPSPTIDGLGVSRVKSTTTALGLFTVPATGLVASTKYSFSAYLITNTGTFYSTPASTFDTLGLPPATLPTVTSPTSSGVTINSAILGGDVTSDGNSAILERGIVYSISSVNDNPFFPGTGVTRVIGTGTTGVFTVPVTGLTAGTLYSYRAYARNAVGLSYTSTIGSFTTTAVNPPTVISPTSGSVTGTTATLGGDVTSQGDSTITERGVVYSITSTNGNPIIGGTGVIKLAGIGTAIGVFTVNVTGLTAGTAYSFKAYATNIYGTSYTSVSAFATSSKPTITTPTFASVTSTSAILGGNVTSDGGSAIQQRGVVYSLTTTDADPSIGDGGVTALSSPSPASGVFTVNVTGLLPGKGYSFKAYAINSAGTSYTTVGTFTTAADFATITSPGLTTITSSTAGLRATQSSDGGSPITERGFVYSRASDNSNPIIGGAGVTKVIATAAPTPFAATITGLTSNTGYIFKAYAINAVGTVYCVPSVFFTTLPPLTVTSPTFANVTATTAALGGTVESDGGTTVSERGVVFSTNSSVPPVILGPGVTKVTGTGTMGPFTVNVTSLLSNQAYYFRAYAISGSVTSYSNTSNFTTLPVPVLGFAQVQWGPTAQVPAVRTYSTAGDSGVSETLASSPNALQFTYQKSADEVYLGNYNYRIEISSDFKNWQQIDGNQWDVLETSTDLNATWKSTTVTPPTSYFFRVKRTKMSSM